MLVQRSLRLPVGLANNLNKLLTKNSTARSLFMFKGLSTSQCKYESETNKLIKLRREREAKEEQTTGFDKMIQYNVFHLKMMKKYDTPEINRKRSIAFINLFRNLGFYVGVLFVIYTIIMYSIYRLEFGRSPFVTERSFWID